MVKNGENLEANRINLEKKLKVRVKHHLQVMVLPKVKDVFIHLDFLKF